MPVKCLALRLFSIALNIFKAQEDCRTATEVTRWYLNLGIMLVKS